MVKELTEYKGITIRVGDYGEFSAIVGAATVKAKTFKDIQESIDKQLKLNRSIERTKAFYPGYHEIEEVEITSITEETPWGGVYVWTVSVKDKSRQKVDLKGLLRYEPAKIEQINNLEKQRKELNDEIELIKSGLRISKSDLIKKEK